MMEKHWSLEAFVCNPKENRYGFTVWVSKQFLEAASSVSFVPDALQKQARLLFQESGARPSDSYRALILGKYGIEQINHPRGDGCWVAVSGTHGNIDRGVFFETHNVDFALDLCALLTVLLWWIQAVEMDIK